MGDQLYTVKQRAREIEVKLPPLVNFVALREGGSLPIQDLTDESIKSLGQQWAKELLALAKSRRG